MHRCPASQPVPCSSAFHAAECFVLRATTSRSCSTSSSCSFPAAARSSWRAQGVAAHRHRPRRPPPGCSAACAAVREVQLQPEELAAHNGHVSADDLVTIRDSDGHHAPTTNRLDEQTLQPSDRSVGSNGEAAGQVAESEEEVATLLQLLLTWVRKKRRQLLRQHKQGQLTEEQYKQQYESVTAAKVRYKRYTLVHGRLDPGLEEALAQEKAVEAARRAAQREGHMPLMMHLGGRRTSEQRSLARLLREGKLSQAEHDARQEEVRRKVEEAKAAVMRGATREELDEMWPRAPDIPPPLPRPRRDGNPVASPAEMTLRRRVAAYFSRQKRRLKEKLAAGQVDEGEYRRRYDELSGTLAEQVQYARDNGRMRADMEAALNQEREAAAWKLRRKALLPASVAALRHMLGGRLTSEMQAVRWQRTRGEVSAEEAEARFAAVRASYRAAREVADGGGDEAATEAAWPRLAPRPAPPPDTSTKALLQRLGLSMGRQVRSLATTATRLGGSGKDPAVVSEQREVKAEFSRYMRYVREHGSEPEPGAPGAPPLPRGWRSDQGPWEAARKMALKRRDSRCNSLRRRFKMGQMSEELLRAGLAESVRMCEEELAQMEAGVPPEQVQLAVCRMPELGLRASVGVLTLGDVVKRVRAPRGKRVEGEVREEEAVKVEAARVKEEKQEREVREREEKGEREAAEREEKKARAQLEKEERRERREAERKEREERKREKQQQASEEERRKEEGMVRSVRTRREAPAGAAGAKGGKNAKAATKAASAAAAAEPSAAGGKRAAKGRKSKAAAGSAPLPGPALGLRVQVMRDLIAQMQEQMRGLEEAPVAAVDRAQYESRLGQYREAIRRAQEGIRGLEQQMGEA